MKKFNKFLKNLENDLYFFSIEEKVQILEDYKDIFEEKKKSGLSEDEILKSFDSPKKIAENYAQELKIKRSKFKKIYSKYRTKLEKNISNMKKKSENKVRVKVKVDKKSIQNKLLNSVLIFIEYCIKLIRYFIKLMKIIFIIFLYMTILCALLLYILSYIYINLISYTLILRFLQSLILISYIICSYLIIDWLRGRGE